MNLLYVLCESSTVQIKVFNSAAQWVGSFTTEGSSGSNVYPMDISSFSYGVYFYLLQSTGPSGTRKSNPVKFAVVR